MQRSSPARPSSPLLAAAIGVTVATLPGCAARPPCPAPCTVAIAHLVPLDGHEVIPLQSGGQVVEAVLDTGSGRTVVTDAAASTLDARAVHNVESSQSMFAPLVAQGAGGDTTAVLTTVENLNMAGGILRDAELIDVPSLRFRDKRVQGLVGMDLLQNWDLDLDIRSAELRLDLPQSGNVVPPWHHATTAVPLEGTQHDQIRITVMLDGHPTDALIDTGAHTLVSADSAAGQEARAGDAAGMSRGVSGIPMRVRRHHYADLSIGGLSFGPIDAAVSLKPDAVPGADMLIGLDVLQMTRIYVAYQAGKLLIDEGGP